jgi:predicted 3-demethylubiquinone-9 3-methyltransferase (glyoxalase superfamily)
VPEGFEEMMKDTSSPGAQRAFAAMMKMKKLDLAALQKAFKG